MTDTLPDALALAERIGAAIPPALTEPCHTAADRRALDRAVKAVERAEEGLRRHPLSETHEGWCAYDAEDWPCADYLDCTAEHAAAWEALRDLAGLYLDA